MLAGLVNGVAGLYFALVAHVAWGPALLIAAGSILGAQLGARYGRRLLPAGAADADRASSARPRSCACWPDKGNWREFSLAVLFGACRSSESRGQSSKEVTK